MSKEAKYLTELRKEMDEMSILEMIDKVVKLSRPNDWNGAFTARGQAKFNLSIEILKKEALRLKEIALK